MSYEIFIVCTGILLPTLAYTLSITNHRKISAHTTIPIFCTRLRLYIFLLRPYMESLKPCVIYLSISSAKYHFYIYTSKKPKADTIYLAFFHEKKNLQSDCKFSFPYLYLIRHIRQEKHLPAILPLQAGLLFLYWLPLHPN